MPNRNDDSSYWYFKNMTWGCINLLRWWVYTGFLGNIGKCIYCPSDWGDNEGIPPVVYFSQNLCKSKLPKKEVLRPFLT